MLRLNWKELNPVRLILNLFGTNKNSQKKPLDSPWQNELENLANRYGENPMRPTTYAYDTASQEAADELKQLCNEVKEDLEGEADRIVVRKERNQSSTTSVDLKAWWGQSVATWDPINAKNVDSIDQQRRPRKTKWFDKQ